MVEHNLSLTIAGLTVRLGCSDERLAHHLALRYQDFPAYEAPHCQALVEWRQEGPFFKGPNPALAFQPGGIQFISEGFEGWIDSSLETAKVSLSTSQPVEAVDYFLRVIYSLLSFRSGGLLFHAAGIVRAGRAFVFFGHSGAGKTTVARCSPNDLVLNDDLLLMLPGAGGWQVHATPFWNPSQVQPRCAQAPLAVMLRLVQDKRVFAEKMPLSLLLAELAANVPVLPADPQRGSAVLDRCLALAQAAPAYFLHFLPDDSFWRVVEDLPDLSPGS